ncbi:MAG: tol-pal system protein YbgF, partial [Desulfovibrio sp.]|nr:tol-pal system protein YbgF [Desulfovibrio sp.]
SLPAASAPAAAPSAAAPSAAAPRTNAVTGAANAVPVPSIPASSLALPPEHPSLAPLGQPMASEPGAPQKALASPVTPQPAAAPAAPAANPRGEEAAYKAALNATLAGKTAEGLRLFQDFLQHYPHGRYAANADYWIGEGLYAQGKYQDALAQFQKVNDTYPQHHKNADALLKAGMTMSRLGDKAAAAEKYRTLMAQFPNSDAARRARAMGVAR